MSLGHVDVTCPTCGHPVHVTFEASESTAPDGAFHVGIASRYVHDCPGPDGGERRVA